MTRKFELTKISIAAVSSVVGKKEGEGPLAGLFDVIETDAMMGQNSWEKAESAVLEKALKLVQEKAGGAQPDCAIAGDLMNQSTTASFVMRDIDVPFFGIFGACSAYGEGLGLASLLLGGAQAQRIMVGAASHFCSSEKQFRFPLELGGQRPQTSTWTVTGAGAAVLEVGGDGPYVRATTTGRIVDMGIKDMSNMRAAMAPAAADTISRHLRSLSLDPSYYDVIATGDLGYVGQDLLLQLMREEGFDISHNHRDCGIEIYDCERQDTHSGGSGCACSAVVFNSLFYPKLKSREIRRMLLVPTGALGNQLTMQQGESIPSIAHAVAIEV